MVIRLSDYKDKKEKEKENQKMVKMPLYTRVFIENNKLIGERAVTGKLDVIKKLRGGMTMASFRKQGSNWEYRIRYRDPVTQKYKETSKRGFKTKKEAQLAAAKVEEEIEGRMYPETSKLTYQQVYDQFWAAHQKTLKPSTRYNNTSKFKRPLKFFGKMYIKEITPDHCQQFVDETAKEIKSVNDNKIQANLVFKYAAEKGIILKNPMEHVVVPKPEEHFLAEKEEERNFWEKAELKSFLKLSKLGMEHMDYIMCYLLIFTGLRKGELLALKWSDIKDNQLNVNKTLYFEKNKEIIQKTKTYATRTIYLDEQISKTIQRWKIKQREELLRFGMAQDPEYVLCRLDLRPLRMAYPNDTLDSFLDRHKLHRIKVHGLRHTHASMLFEAGASIKEVQVRLGHKDIQTTMNVYTHVTKDVKVGTTNLLAKYINEN